MTFTAKIHNGSIAVPPELALPEGAEVKVQTAITPDSGAVPDLEKNGSIAEAEQNTGENPFAWMRKYIGCIKDGPEDWADEHDHYIHGTPKREKR